MLNWYLQLFERIIFVNISNVQFHAAIIDMFEYILCLFFKFFLVIVYIMYN